MRVPLSMVLAVALLCGGGVAAQQRVRTETITPSSPAAAPAPQTPAAVPRPGSPAPATVAARAAAHVVRPDASASVEIVSDIATLPPAVARMRARILEAARSGELAKVVAVMEAAETMPVFSLGNDPNPITYWKMGYPDSDGVEVLAILSEILEAPPVRVDKGTAQEMYVWPYFARIPLGELTPAQKVELFKIVTGSDFKEMQEFGAYMFYRVGIGADGKWYFFVAGD